ncbi:CRISPR-associated endonuclease Cas1, partial [Sphingomonas antarctica]|uniref:CRISPR-associated endonuclease Cas1 n=1 Tax=Sphingomonas antarctica TaxID=2040274 RepID=UPI0039E91535
CGHGVSLRVESGALVIRDGFTHYPQQQAKHRLYPGHRDTPTRIIVLDGSGTLSFAVISWCTEQGVALARVSWTGEVAAIASGTGFAGDPAKIEWQNRMRASEPDRLTFATDLIARKLNGCVAVLADHVPASRKRDLAVAKHDAAIGDLRAGRFATVNDIRGIEGQCASCYFLAWEGLELSWTGRGDVPPNWQRFETRSSLAKSGLKPTNYAASHPINAMLNYAYAVRQCGLQIQAIAEGYDIRLGIFHHGKKGNAAYAFDLIEPERPKVDAAVLAFAASRQFAVADFILRKDGVCRLSPQLARAVAQLVV